MACTIPSPWEGGEKRGSGSAALVISGAWLPPAPPLPPAGWRRPAARRGACGGVRRLFPPLSPPPALWRLRPGRHVVAAAAAAGAAAVGAYGACTERSSIPRTGTQASGCSLHQVTQRGSEVGQALPQRRSLVLHRAPLTGPGGARPHRGGAGPSLGQETRVPFSEGWGRSLGCCARLAPALVW